jgi:chromosome segregation protein
MQDVIFNGSTARKPASRASVELVFDNSAGRAAGQWSQYGEISVKRVLTRDGTSSYYINNLPVRRRDIQDIFLGTGLGPRAYAIIGQGMISRIIEAKPEELRIFIEEAAGVSKYKERRRETENRLHDTRENLTRVEDILRELNSTLEKLAAQASVAQQFSELTALSEEKQRLLWLLRKNEALAEQQRQQQALAAAQLEKEAQLAQLRSIEAQLETVRAASAAASDALHNAQGALYETNAEVSRLEAELKFIAESRNRLHTQLSTLDAQREQWLTQADRAHDELAQAEAALTVAEENHARADTQAQLALNALPELEARWRAAQNTLDSQRAEIARIEQALKLEAVHQRNADQQLQQLQLRKERLQQETHALDEPQTVQLENSHAELAEHEARLEDIAAQLEQAQHALPQCEAARQAAQQRAQQESAQIAQLEARLSALQQVQQNVQTDGKLSPWLQKHGLTDLPALWKKLHIETGWETALEAVLRERLAAIEISNLDWAHAFATDAPAAKLAVFSTPTARSLPPTPAGFTPLLGLMRIPDPSLRIVLADWLLNLFIIDDLAQGIAARATLPEGGAFVVREGHLVTRHSVLLYAADSEQAGLLARAQEIENLERQLKAQQLLAEEARAAATHAEAAYRQATQVLAEARQQKERATQHHHALQLDVLKLTQQQERYLARSSQINDELDEIAAQMEEQHALRAQAEAQLEQCDAELAQHQSRFEDERLAFDALNATLSTAHSQVRELERAAQQARYEEHNTRERIATAQRDIHAAHEQTTQLEAALDQTHSELEAIHQHSAQASLQDALARRVDKEAGLAAARDNTNALAAQLRELDEQRLRAEQAQHPLNDRIVEWQLKEQASRLNAEQYAQQLEQAGADQAILQTQLTPDLKGAYLQSEVTRLNMAIAALGPVNMAALGELSTAREREQFLSAQLTDLLSAAATLEEAIRTIDAESRALLQQTFDEINHHFGELFPRLFGGGQARLLMTGNEILDTGVQVMAQPPGKKNSTIHLLSGGEKALTATALVFAMFQLNPAPFCLLDEVDAPLDDANTERFAKLVRAMSDKTQFLFISHNKIAMEMAQQLIGVTMQEQGVSRIVVVDIEAAAHFAQSAT